MKKPAVLFLASLLAAMLLCSPPRLIVQAWFLEKANPPADWSDDVGCMLYVPVDGHIAWYSALDNSGLHILYDKERRDLVTANLAPFVGEEIDHNDTWGTATYTVKGLGSNQYVILENDDGSLLAFEFFFFVSTGDPEDDEWWLEKYPQADLSPLSFGQILELIYGVEGPGDLARVTTQREIMLGGREEGPVYSSRAELREFYDELAPCPLVDEVEWSEDNIKLKMTIKLKSGVVIDMFHYYPLRGEICH